MTENKKVIKKIFKVFEQKYVIQNAYYKSGYFVFEMGKDSVCHFEIKGFKGWLFGIWINSDNTVDMFCQYKKYIDKFKPSASCFSTNFNKEASLKYSCNPVDCFMSDIELIKKYPFVARCYDLRGHTKYISPFNAMIVVLKIDFEVFYRDKKKKIKNFLFNNEGKINES